MPVKAPPAAAPVTSDVHGFFEISFKNDYITPRGLLVTNTGLTTQAIMGLALDLYKDKGGFINDVSVYGYMWNDLWSEQHDPHVGSWNEFDWAVGMAVKFAQNWKFTVEYVEFLPPAHDLITSFPSTERNIEFGLFYDDSWFWGGAPFAVNPYVKLFWHTSGPSPVVFGKTDNSYDVELGIVPTYDFKKSTGVAFSLMAPTWITVGPTDFWSAGTTFACGPLSSSPCALSNAGVVSTGLTGKLMLSPFIPTRLGNWYVKGGFQYYHIINDSLLAAQEATGTAGGASNVSGTFPKAHRDVVVGFGAVGFSF